MNQAEASRLDRRSVLQILGLFSMPFAARAARSEAKSRPLLQTGRRHGYQLYFKNNDFDFMLLWVFAAATAQGATAGEALVAVTGIKEEDPSSWVTGWLKVAARARDLAREYERNGHRVSAREAYLRAYNYFISATYMTKRDDAKGADIWRAGIECFQKAASMFAPSIERITIPFENVPLEGYFMKARAGREALPTLLIVGGGEGTCESGLFYGGFAGTTRGYNVLFVDLPGQGSAAKLRGTSFRADAEKPIGAIIDYALERPDVDAQRFAIYGLSFGGYFVTRAAVHDKRIKACIASAPMWDAYDVMAKNLPGNPAVHTDVPDSAISPITRIMFGNVMAAMGVQTMAQFFEREREFTYKGRIHEIACPVLCMVGQNDVPGHEDHSRIFYDQLQTSKTWVYFNADSGADAHCQAGNLALAQATVFNWLDDLWRKRPA